MEIEVTQEKLSRALNNVSRIAVGRVTLPVLNNVLIRVEDGKVSLVTTNLDMAIVNFLPVSNSKNGVVTIPARLLTEFVSNLPRGEKIKISASGPKITVSAGKYTSTINGSLADDFPELPEIDEKSATIFKIGADEFKNGVTMVAFAAGRDTSRPALTGVNFNTIDDCFTLAATDGYRLAEKKLIKNVKSEVNAVVPATSLQEVLRSIGDDVEEVEIAFNDDLVRFRLGEVEVISKLIDMSYPDYRRLIPKDSEIHLELNRAELVRIAKLAALFARSVAGSIVCETKSPNTFLIHSTASELGENSSSIETEVSADAKVNINARYFIEALNTLDDDMVSLNFTDHSSPIVIHNKKQDYTHIVMPLNQ